MTEVGAIVIGAGHNGMSAAATLAKQGLKVLVLEKQRYVGGMAGTTEYFKGYKHKVGAWALMVSSRSIIETLELEKHGFSTIDPPTSLCAFGDPGNTPYVLYNDPAKLAAQPGATTTAKTPYAASRASTRSRVPSPGPSARTASSRPSPWGR